MTKGARNMGASVRARLLNLARERGQTFDLLLTRYALERLLYRLSVSGHRDRFVLKGALLITTWFDDPNRPTRDLDLLGYGDSSSEAILATFRDICKIIHR
jgi:predicted nucleotidyltransferase component of viral defense system